MAELPDKSTGFIDWYLEAIEAAGLSDKRYGVKGMNVWTPYGFRARRLLDAVLIREIEATGSNPVEFPLLIPQTEFQKEKEHIKGFDAQVYWVTRGGLSELDVPLVLRPTSETAMYPVFALWIRSHQDLPLNVYQVVNVFRYETKTTRPFLRIREIHFFEEHTCQVDEARATERVGSNLAAFARMADDFVLPYIALRRPEWDKFPGAHYSVALDIPVGGARTLQIGSIHHYRDNFSRPYGISFETAAGAREFVHQTTFGLSERLLGAVVAVHGDRKGVVLPSGLAPYQAVIVPIPSKETPAPLPAAQELARELAGAGFRVDVDGGDERPGAKYYYWETRGVPVRLEVGPREAARGTLTIVDRLGRKSEAAPGARVETVRAALAAYDAELAQRAQEVFSNSFTPAVRLEDLANSATVRYFPWCGGEECGHKVETAIDGALLGVPEGEPPFPLPEPGACLVCGSTNGTRWAFAGRPL